MREKKDQKQSTFSHLLYYHKDIMGCGASKATPRVQAPTLNKKSTLPAIAPQSKKKVPSAKSNGSTDSGIEDSEPIKSRF